jgi:dihydroxy-acid dehydratase
MRWLQKVTLKSQGNNEKDVSRPLIGIANTYGEGIAGHSHYRLLADYLRRGIYRAGGVTSEFGAIAVCDAMAAVHAGHINVLPSRDVITDSIEIMARAHAYDGLVLMASCDKIVPASLMAAARLDIPCIVLVGGPMLSTIVVNGHKGDLTTIAEALGQLQTGTISQEQIDDLTDVVCPTCGSCQFYGTANTMCCMAESLGMTLTGSALIPAPYTDKLRDCTATGERIVDLVRKGITARQIMTKDAVKNAIKIAMATGASTNMVIHFLAITHELGFDPKEVHSIFNECNDSIPQLVQVNPAATYDMEDFFKAGGIPRVMKHLGDRLNLDVLTVTGKTLRENLASYRFKWPEDTRVIRSADKAFEQTGGLVLVKGNLAPETAVAKPSGIAPEIRKFTGPAIVFNSEEECSAGIDAGKVKPGNVIVLRYEGPKGGPGMREMVMPLKALKGKGMLLQIALISDGRFSGTNAGCFVGHVCPEAAEGGPLAIVRDGDIITVDTVEKREIHLHLSDEEIAARLKEWRYEPKKLTGVLKRYVSLVQPASVGAYLDTGNR